MCSRFFAVSLDFFKGASVKLRALCRLMHLPDNAAAAGEHALSHLLLPGWKFPGKAKI